MSMKRFLVTFNLLLIVSIALSACTGSPATPAATAEPKTVKITVLPILDTLPMYVAQQEGLYAKHNIQVEFIPAASAGERDQIIAAGQADGMINELVSTMFYNKDAIQIQVVRFARVATSTHAQFHILVASGSGINSAADLKGVEIGISTGTVIEYLTDRLLQAEGLASEDIKTISVPKLADRMSLLASGQLKAAMLPDPMSFLAEQQGAAILLDDTSHPEYAYSVISFRKEYLDQNAEAVRGFLAAIEEATALINADPGKWSSLLSDQKLVPAPLLESYKVGPYPTKGIPSEAQWQDVINWALDKGLLEKDLPYKDSVTDVYLP